MDKNFEVQKIREMYHTPGCQDHQLRPKNAIYISGSNKPKHELSKAIAAIMLRKCGDLKFTDNLIALLDQIDIEIMSIVKEFPKDKADFITECCLDSKPNRRIDLVRLSDNQKFEFECDSTIKKDNCCTILI